MKRMRTLNQTLAYIKENDPGSCISMNWLRTLIVSGEVPSHKAGRRYLVDLDALEQYLANPPERKKVEEEKPYYGYIRRVRQ